MHAIKNLSAAFLMTTLPASALAQDAEGGFYLEAFGGGSALQDTNVSGEIDGEATFGTGYVSGLALGYAYGGSPFRSEVEYAYRTGEADSFAGGASGDFASTTFMLNGYYDFETGGAFTPYLGLGIGYVTEIDWDISGGSAPGEYSDRGGLAFQAMAGTAYSLSDRWSLTGELRYMDAGSRTLTGSDGEIDADYATFESVVGVVSRF